MSCKLQRRAGWEEDIVWLIMKMFAELIRWGGGERNLAVVQLNCNPLSGVSCTLCRRRTFPASSRRSAWSTTIRTRCGTPQVRNRCTLFSVMDKEQPSLSILVLMLNNCMFFLLFLLNERSCTLIEQRAGITINSIPLKTGLTTHLPKIPKP